MQRSCGGSEQEAKRRPMCIEYQRLGGGWLGLCLGEMRAERQAGPRALGPPGDRRLHISRLMPSCSFLAGVLSAEHQG